MGDRFLPVCLLLFSVTPLLCYYLYPPTIKRSTEVSASATTEFVQMGDIARRELAMALLALGALGSWSTDSRWISATTVALVVISLMVLTKVVLGMTSLTLSRLGMYSSGSPRWW